MSDGELVSGTSSVPAISFGGTDTPLILPFSGGLSLVSQTTSLIVQNTTNTFDTSGYLAQSVDALLAPENIGGSDVSTLEPWGTQITVYNVPGNTEWNLGSQYSSATLTLNDQGQTIETSFQGGPNGPANTLFKVFDPNKTADLSEEIQTTTAFKNSDANAGDVSTIVTEFDTGDNPFWDSYDWGNAAGSVDAEIYGNDVILPPNAVASAPQFIDLIGSYDTITGSAGSTIWVNGTEDVINLPGGTLNLWADSSAVVNGDDVTVWTVSAGTVTVTGSGDVVTGAPSTIVNLAGNNDVAGLSSGSTVTVGGQREVTYGDSLNLVMNASTASISAQGNSNNINATLGGSITVVGTNDTITLGSAPITLNASPNDAVEIDDTADGFVASLGELVAWNASGWLTGIILTDPGTPVISLTPTQITADAAVINLIDSPFTIDAVSVTAAYAATVAATAHVDAISVRDTAVNVVANLSGLEALAASGYLQAVYLTDPETPVISLTPAQIAADAAVINLIDSPFTLDPVSSALASSVTSDPPAAAAPVSSTEGIAALDTSTDQPIPVVSQAYTGPVVGLQNEYIEITGDSINISVSTPNWFLHSGSGNDAIAASSGTNVLDGGTGSNFLVGGSGSDTFFADARGATAPIWDTIVNFHPGDSVTIWGVTAADFTFHFADNMGAAGYTGLTLTATAPSKPTVSVTFAGLTMADLNVGTLTETFGTIGGSVYTYVHEMNEPESSDLFGDKAVRRIVIPYGTTLSPRVLLGAMRKMPTMDIERTIEELIAELDVRSGTPDDEPEPEEPIG